MATKDATALSEPASRASKSAAVKEIQVKLAESDAAVLTEYRGLTVSELAQLRQSLRGASTEYKVFKNTLARLAVEGAGRPELLPLLSGPTAFAFVRGDAVEAAKAFRAFGAENPALVIKGGLLGDRFLTPADVAALAKVPPRDDLLAMLAGAFQAPLTKTAGLLQAFTRNMAYGVKAYLDQRIAVEGAPEVEVAEVETEVAEVEVAEVEVEVAEAEVEVAEVEVAEAEVEVAEAEVAEAEVETQPETE